MDMPITDNPSFPPAKDIDGETSDLWADGIKDFEKKGGFAALNKPTSIIKPKITLTLTSIDDILDYEEPRYLVHPIITEGTVNLFSGGGGKGKSIVTLAVAKAILTGAPLWGRYPVTRTGPVLIVDEETPRSFLKDRIEKMGFDKDLPLYFLHFQDIRLDNDQIFEALFWKIIEVNPVLIVFDSLVRLHRQQENDPVAMSTVMAKFRKIANCGPTVWLIHHHKKGGGPLEDKARGSTDIVAGVDIEYSLVSESGYLNFSSVKTRVEPFGPIRLKFEVSDSHIGVVYEGDERENVLQEVFDILEGESLKAGEIHERLRDRGIEVGINRLREILKGATELSPTKSSGRGGGFIYSLKDSPLEGKFHSSPPYKGGVKQCNLNSFLNGQSENSDITREAITLDSQGPAEVSWGQNEGSGEAVKLDFFASRADQKNEGNRETSDVDKFEEMDEGE